MLLQKKLILLIFLTLQTLSIYSQNQNNFPDSIRARDINRIANDFGREGMHLQALDTFFLGLELRKKLYGEEHYNLGAVYSGIGISYRALGQNALALKYFKLAEKNYLTSPKFSVSRKSRLYTNIGNVYRSKLDYNRALLYFNRTLEIYQNDKESNIEDIASINYKIADIYYFVDEYSKALELIKNNIENAFTDDQILFYELLAFINQVTGNHIEAKRNYQKTIELTILLAEDEVLSQIQVAIRYLNYSQFLIKNKEFVEADTELIKAFEIIKILQPKNGYDLAEYFNLKGLYVRRQPIEKSDVIAFADTKKNNLNEAIVWYKKALVALKFPEDYSIKSIKNSSSWISLFDCIDYLKNIADIHKEIANVEQNKQSVNYINSLKQALKNYKIASALIQKARMELSSDESKIQLTELEYSTFQNFIKTAFDAYSATNNMEFIELAFQNAERIKGSSVFDKLSNESALQNSLIPDSLIQLERKWNNTIAIFSEKLFDENNEELPDTVLLTEYNTRIFNATREREELNQYMETEYSDYYDLKYSTSMLSISEIQQKMPDDAIILEYILNENDSVALNENDSIMELYTFVISKYQIDFIKEEVGTVFSNSIENMFHFMSNPRYMLTTNNESKLFCVSANQLFNHLILPFSDEIQNKKLIIVPDGKLSYIAFDALLQSLPDTSKTIQFNKLDYLIKDFTVNYSNSSNLLFKQNKSSKKLRNKAIAFAPEYHSETIEIANQKIVLLPLPGVQKEVELISKTINTKVFAGKEATESNFRNNVENYDILHLAMHAYINDSLPAFSRLAFTQDTNNTISTDGWINTADIYNLDLNARLTVLSACNTGRGQLKKGEGIMSLARGFFYAGCPSIIMSLWEVEDQSGTQIMRLFYKNLKKGKNKDEALRLAKLEYLENSNSRRAHPHYWLGYVSIGDDSPLYKSYDFYFFALLIFALISIFIDQTIRMKKARIKRAS